MAPMTLQELTEKSGISPSYLGRIERGERFPSAGVLQKIAGPIGFEVGELFALAGYLTPQPDLVSEEPMAYSGSRQLDPYVSRVLAREPLEVQRAVIGIVSILKNISKTDALV